MKPKKTKKYRREVTTDPDEKRRTFTLVGKARISKEEFIEAMIDYIAENADECPSMILANDEYGDPSVLH